MSVDIFIDFAQSYAESHFNHQTIRDFFSVNREVRLTDLELARNSIKFNTDEENGLTAAETSSSFV